MIVCFPLFFISRDRFKTESGEFRTGRKVEIFTRLRAAYVVFKKKELKFNFHQNAKSECLLSVQRTKIKFWRASSNPVGCLASPNTGDFARKKSPTGGEIQELGNAQFAKSPHQPRVPPPPQGRQWQVHYTPKIQCTTQLTTTPLYNHFIIKSQLTEETFLKLLPVIGDKKLLILRKALALRRAVNNAA